MSMEEGKEPLEATLEVAGENQGPERDGVLKDEPDQDFFVKTLEDLRKERDEFQDLLQRKQAEFENYRKRVAREREDVQIAAKADVLKEVLSVVDACEKGLRTLEEIESEPMRPYVEGYQLLLKSLKGVLERFGVEEVAGPGSIFDPTVHEAVIREIDQERADGEILEEYRKGYTIQGRLLRPSQVKVSVQPEERPTGKSS